MISPSDHGAPVVGRGRLGWRVVCVAALVIPWALSMPVLAQGPGIEAARAAFYDASFRRARDLFTEVLASPELTRDDATEAYRFLATIELLLRRADAARGHATRAVALDPHVEPPEGSSSRAGRLFDEARQALDGEALRLRIVAEASDTGGRIVTARLTPDVAELVTRLRLRCTRGDDDPSPRAADALVADSREVALSLPDAHVRWSCAATAETSSGATLVRAVHRTARVTDRSSGSEGRDRRRRREDDDSGMPVWPWLVGGAGAIVVGAVIVGIVVASSGDDLTRIELGPIDVPAWR